jgi:hypothetical protein
MWFYLYKFNCIATEVTIAVQFIISSLVDGFQVVGYHAVAVGFNFHHMVFAQQRFIGSNWFVVPPFFKNQQQGPCRCRKFLVRPARELYRWRDVLIRLLQRPLAYTLYHDFIGTPVENF